MGVELDDVRIGDFHFELDDFGEGVAKVDDYVGKVLDLGLPGGAKTAGDDLLWGGSQLLMEVSPLDIPGWAADRAGDLDVESDEFNRHWRVKTADPLGAHGLLTPRLIELLIDERSKGLAIQCDGTRVVIWDDAREGTADAEDRLELLQGFVERLPGFAKRRQA